MAKSDLKYLALLRGINVGGKNIIPKDDLRECFEDLGFSAVRTYIQSGNILFRSSQTRTRELTQLIESRLSQRFNYPAQAVVLSYRKYRLAVAAAPADWGVDDNQKHNALFMMAGARAPQVLAELAIPPKVEFETVTIGPGVVFWSVSKAKFGMSAVSRLAAMPIYQKMTVRNHNTVFKLLNLFEEI